jgi:hypothetical protein
LVAFDEGVIFEIEHPGDAAGAVCAAAGTVTRSVAPAVTAQINPAAVSRFLCELRCVMVLIPSIEGAPNRTPGLQLRDHLAVQGRRLGFSRHPTGPKTTDGGAVLLDDSASKVGVWLILATHGCLP